MSQTDKLPVWWESRRLTFEICFPSHTFSHVVQGFMTQVDMRDGDGGAERNLKKTTLANYCFILKGRRISQWNVDECLWSCTSIKKEQKWFLCHVSVLSKKLLIKSPNLLPADGNELRHSKLIHFELWYLKFHIFILVWVCLCVSESTAVVRRIIFSPCVSHFKSAEWIFGLLWCWNLL